MASQSRDIVIVGGSIVGCATAYYLAQAGAIAGRRIAIVEKDPTYATCSTARSAGGLRQQFSTPENIAMSQVTLALIRDLKDRFGPEADVAFREQGYLILASADGAEVIAASVETQRRHGADILLLDRDELAARFPWLDLAGVACGSFGQSGEGWIDPVSLMTLFRTAARGAGVELIHDAVVGLEKSGDAVESVALASGTRLAAGTVVNAAGPAAGEVAALAGVRLPVEPRKRYVYVIDCRDAPEELRRGPLTVDPTGVWFRPEGRLFITGISPEERDEPPAIDLDAIDYSLFEEEVWPRLAARVPLFESIKVVNAWAGFYDYNTLDQNAIIGPHPEVRNFYFANGFSGHGLQQAAAAGRAVSELILHGRFCTIDLTRFGYARIAEGRPLRELNVI
ncbi:MAG: FAD-binding oxidoreductase [Hyphomicrobiaceae bacterium]|nr:FAD-binding oxidoreductase [Hyphomicrobiaceae bacterium]